MSTVLGFADVIISPAFKAISKRKSWTSWRLGSAIILEEAPLAIGGIEVFQLAPWMNERIGKKHFVFC